MTKIIGISGKKASGKTTSAQFLIDKYLWQGMKFNIKKYSFADALKQIATNIIGLPDRLVYGTQADKSASSGIHSQDLYDFSKMIYKLCSNYPLERFVLLQNKELSIRNVLQIVGHFFRCLNKDSWINATFAKINEERPEIAIIDDVRFPNEANRIHSENGLVIRLTRSIDNDVDISETALDTYSEFDSVINNTNLNIDNRNQLLIQFFNERIINAS